MKLTDEEFLLGNMVDNLLEYTLTICGKDYNNKKRQKTLRFPERFYDNYVSCIINVVLKIHKSVILANSYELGEARQKLQREAAFNCVELNHLIRVASNKGYISQKQRDHWQELTTKTYYKITYWVKSDLKRK